MLDNIEKVAEIFKALSDPTRLKILVLLSNAAAPVTLDACTPETCTGKGGPLCVNALVNRLGVTQSAVSQHLRVLRQSGLVVGERQGAFVHYTVNHDALAQFKPQLRTILGDLL